MSNPSAPTRVLGSFALLQTGTVRARVINSAMLGERKNVNLPGVIVDLPVLEDKDIDDIVNWGVPNEIDFIAASFVRKGADIKLIRDVSRVAPAFSRAQLRNDVHSSYRVYQPNEDTLSPIEYERKRLEGPLCRPLPFPAHQPFPPSGAWRAGRVHQDHLQDREPGGYPEL